MTDSPNTSGYPTYDDGEPIPNAMCSMITGRVWNRGSDGLWFNGVMSGDWAEIERREGPFVPFND